MTYLTKSIPKSVREVLDVASQDKVLTIAKNTIASYIDNFLNKTGVNRAIAKEIGSDSLQFVTDRTVTAGTAESPSEFMLELAIASEHLIERVPAIIIADTGIEWEPSGLGHRDAINFEGSTNISDFSFLYKIPLTLVVLTEDEVSTKDLSLLLSMMFGPLQILAGGSRIASLDPKSHWVITLPMTLPAVSYEKIAIEGDSINKKWAGTFNLEIKYEGHASIRTTEETVTSIEGKVAPPATDYAVVISGPDSVRVGESLEYSARYMLQGDRIIVNPLQPMILTWDEKNKTHVSIQTSNLGEFEVIVISDTGVRKATKKVTIDLS